jgi:hypothetical protein
MYDSAPADDLLRASGFDPDDLRVRMPRVDPATVTVKVASPLFRRLWAKGISAVSLPTGVYVQPSIMERLRSGDDRERFGRLIIHELMHIEQWRRLGALRHLYQYVGDYVRGRWQRLGHWEAYRAIRLEIEAREAASSVSQRRPM